MADFQINLIRDRVPPAAVRLRRFWVMVAYLILCGILIVIASYRAVEDGIAADNIREEMMRQERFFCQARPGSRGILDCYQKVSRMLESSVRALESVNRVMASRVHLARVLLRIQLSLPAGVTLHSAQMDSANRAFDFELSCQEGVAPEGISPSDLVDAWRRDGTLMTEIRDAVYQSSQQRMLDGRTYTIWKFTAQLVRET